jgi:putative tryptophan/tyrosine transport system substrate-binding protein
MSVSSENRAEKAMKREITVLTLSTMLFALCCPAEAQQPKKVFRIGYLSGTDRVTHDPRAEGTRRALRELGYIEGQNIIIEYRHAEGKAGRNAELAAELVRLNVDLIVVAGGEGNIRAATNATKTIPIVMMGQADPVNAGFVASLARPGGNVTGFTDVTTDLSGKRLELLKEAVPKLARVAVFYNPTGRSTVVEVKEEIPIAARALKLTIQTYEARDTADLEKVLTGLSKNRPDGLYMPGGVVRPAITRVINFALKSRLPSMYAYPLAVEAGGLMSYSAEEAERYKRVAYYVDKILKGTKPSDLPVEQPKKFELIINLKAAKQIGLTIPPTVLARADKLIK